MPRHNVHSQLTVDVQVNEALSDKPSGQLDHSMRVEMDQVVHVGQRITLCMARCRQTPGEPTFATPSCVPRGVVATDRCIYIINFDDPFHWRVGPPYLIPLPPSM